MAFVLLCNLGSTAIVIHSVKQGLLRNWPGSNAATSCTKDYKGHSLVQTCFTEPPNSDNCCVCVHIILYVNCALRVYRILYFGNMYRVSAHGFAEYMINVHY